MESRFGFSIDFDNLTFRKAFAIVRGLNESIDTFKKSKHGHIAEKNPKYMELIMVRESLHKWMLANERKMIAESEMAKSEAILAAKDMVDSIQDMMEKISKMQVEQMPALLDTIRDQIGTDSADQFKQQVGPLLDGLAETLRQGRETADAAARSLAGEQVDQDMGMPGAAPGTDGGLPPEPGPELNDMDDDFEATDAAAGGPDELGRELR